MQTLNEHLQHISVPVYHLLNLTNANDGAATDKGTYKWQLRSGILPEDGTHVPQDVGDAHLTFWRRIFFFKFYHTLYLKCE